MFGAGGRDILFFETGVGGKSHAAAGTIPDVAASGAIDLTGRDANCGAAGIQAFDVVIGSRGFGKKAPRAPSMSSRQHPAHG